MHPHACRLLRCCGPGGPIEGGTPVTVRGMNFVDSMGNGSSSKAGLLISFAGIGRVPVQLLLNGGAMMFYSPGRAITI